MAAGDGIMFTGRVTGIASLELEGGMVLRSVIVDLGRAGNRISFDYTSSKDGGLDVKPDDLVQVKLEVLGASKYDVG